MEQKKIFDNFLIIVPLLCALMVVGIHCYGVSEVEQMTITARIEGFFSHGLFMSAVPIFFFISGYLFYYTVKKKSDIYEKQKRRLKSVLIPFISWSSFYYIFYAVSSRIFDLSIAEVEISIYGILKGIIFYLYCFPMWFMFQLIVYVVIAPLIYKVLKSPIISIVLVIILCVLGVLQIEFKVFLNGTERTLFAPNYFIYYFIGCICAQHENVNKKYCSLINNTPTIACLGALLFFSIIESYVYDVIPIYNKRIFVPFIAYFMMTLLFKIAKWITDKNIKIIPIIPTMVIYGVHPFVGLILGKLLMRLSMPELFRYTVSFASVVIVSGVIAVMIKKIKWLNYVFNGDRK